MIEVVELIKIGLMVLLGVVGFFVANTLRSIDRNQALLFERQAALERDFYELRGEHRSCRERMQQKGGG